MTSLFMFRWSGGGYAAAKERSFFASFCSQKEVLACFKKSDGFRCAAPILRLAASGKRVGDFTKSQKNAFKAQNAAANGGKMACVSCGREVQNIASQKGVKTPSNQAQVHHDPAIVNGGGKDSTGQVLCPTCHQDKHGN